MKDEIYGFESTNEIEGLSEVLSEEQVCYRYQNEPLIVCEISSQTREKTDMQESPEAAKQFFAKLDCAYLLLISDWQTEVRLLFLSNNKSVRALEFLDALVSEYGLVKGDEAFASARVSSALLQAEISNMELNGVMEYFLKMADEYFTECNWIYAKQYSEKQRDEIMEFDRYKKKKIAWAFVKTTDIANAGCKLLVKSLENESGTEITVSENLYIMIGCRGEVYYIEKEKFDSTYEVTEEILDIFEQMLDFLPEVETVPEGEYISLDEMARLCFPKSGKGIYVKQLEERTKVFPADDSEDYFLGRPGDYMAVRADDLSDIYIIRKDIFRQTYELMDSSD